MMVSPMLQSYQGPSDRALRSNAVEGYSQVSRVGEVLINAFVDSYEFASLPAQFTTGELSGKSFKQDDTYVHLEGTPDENNRFKEARPHFYEWATAYTGMIAVQRKQRNNYRSNVAAETSAPVIVCAAGKGPIQEFDFQFAGVVRSNSVRTIDDGMGPTVDEYFTLTIGGPQTILNNCHTNIYPGDQISWTFYSEDKKLANRDRSRSNGPRRIGVKPCGYHDENIIGRALTFAKPGQMFDVRFD